MLGFLVRRFASLVLVLLAVSVVTFCIVNVLPGDVATAVLGDLATPEQVAGLRARLGLNEPLPLRYLEWISSVVHGDFGTSLQHGQKIAPILLARLGNSAILGLLGLVIAVPASVALGVLAALRPGRMVDRCISGFAVTAYALPEYVMGLILILLFSIWLQWLPGSSLMDPNENPLARPAALVLPVGVMVTGMLAFMSQVTRATMIEVLGSDYVRTAILKGLPAWAVVLKHALPNALPPIIAEIGMNFGYVIGGLVVVETLFSYAGLGQMVTNAVNYRDIPTIEAAVLVVAAAYGIGNLLADTAALVLNPRLRS
jgi:peptide/nickel transport system permease protein